MAILPARQPLDVISMQLVVMRKRLSFPVSIQTEFTSLLMQTWASLQRLAGLLTVARMTSAQPTYGQNYEMDAIGSCFIGGASAYGGIRYCTWSYRRCCADGYYQPGHEYHGY